MIDFSNELKFQTTRSGGKGGQNVNKVETAVIAYLNIRSSMLLSDDQKKILEEKLVNRINAEGMLIARSQSYRTQIENKSDATNKVNEMIALALKKKKMRLAIKPSKKEKEKRLESKKRSAEKKEGRKKFRF